RLRALRPPAVVEDELLFLHFAFDDHVQAVTPPMVVNRAGLFRQPADRHELEMLVGVDRIARVALRREPAIARQIEPREIDTGSEREDSLRWQRWVRCR